MKKTVLIYGDSNVWGNTPDAKRLPDEQQWAQILATNLGENYKIVQEGLCGRYAGGFEFRERSYYNGHRHFEAIFRTASPVDFVIIALGTNDLNPTYGRTIKDIADDILWYGTKIAQIIAGSSGESLPQFLFILPPNFDTDKMVAYFPKGAFDEAARLKVNKILKSHVPDYLEFNEIDLSEDGLHFSVQGHAQMAAKVFAKMKEMENGQ